MFRKIFVVEMNGQQIDISDPMRCAPVDAVVPEPLSHGFADIGVVAGCRLLSKRLNCRIFI
jgi:hypothetical protein